MNEADNGAAPDDAWPPPPARSGQRLFVLKEGDSFLVADAMGDITGDGDGLFHNDTRLLSTFRVLMDGRSPTLLSSAVSQDNAFFTANLTNHPLPPLGGASMPEGVIHLERRRFLWGNRVYERISLVNCRRHANMRSLFRRIKRNGVAMSTLRILGTALVLAFGSQPIQSARAAESSVVTPFMLKELADIPGKEMLMITVDYPPGAVDPVHRHDAHAFVYVLQGSIVMQVRGGKEVTLVPGQTFYEGPNDVHTVGRNASTTEPAKFIVILLKKKGVDVVLPAE